MTGGVERRRPLLPASVAPEAALVFSAVLSRREMREELARYDRVLSTRGMGGAVWVALAQLDEAARQWRERDEAGSDDGTTELAVAEPQAGSEAMELTTRQVADRLRCTTKWVTRLIARGDLAARKSGGSWLVDRASVEVYRDARRSA